MTDAQANAQEELGQAIDELGNLTLALTLPMPTGFHVEVLQAALPELVTRMKEYFSTLTGESPWREDES